MKYNMNGVPAAAEIDSFFTGENLSEDNSGNNVVRLSIDSVIKNINGDELIRTVQEGFSEIAVTSGGKVYEY